MITDSMIRGEFVHQVVSRGIKRIYATQTDVVGTYLTGGTGQLKAFLSKAPFDLRLGGWGVDKVYYIRLLRYLRFLDIKHRKDKMKLRRNLHLYNKVVWGVIRGEIEPELLYGFTEEVRESVRAELEESLKEK